MSFGLTNAPAYFMYLMNKVFMVMWEEGLVAFTCALGEGHAEHDASCVQ
jgi:hypothetical protein